MPTKTKAKMTTKQQMEELLHRRNQKAIEIQRAKAAQEEYDNRIKELAAEHRDELFSGKKSQRFETGKLAWETRKAVSIPAEQQTSDLLQALHDCGLTTSQAGVKLSTTGYNKLMEDADGQKVAKAHLVALKESEHLKID